MAPLINDRRATGRWILNNKILGVFQPDRPPIIGALADRQPGRLASCRCPARPANLGRRPQVAAHSEQLPGTDDACLSGAGTVGGVHHRRRTAFGARRASGRPTDRLRTEERTDDDQIPDRGRTTPPPTTDPTALGAGRGCRTDPSALAPARLVKPIRQQVCRPAP